MTKTLLVAATKAPTADTWQAFKQAIRDTCEHMKIRLGKMGVVDGPSCANYNFEFIDVPADELERVATMITKALFPARYTLTDEPAIEGYHLTR